jgi:predicted peroxiredoxin
MSISYTPITNYGAKDSLAANDPAKVIRGSYFTSDFEAISDAFALAAPAASPTFTGTATFSALSAGGYSNVNWSAAYDDKINAASFNTSDGVLTLTQQDGGTVTVDLDGRYVTSVTAYTASNGVQLVGDDFSFSGAYTGSLVITGTTEVSSTATFNSRINEQQYALTGTVIDPANGTLQYKTLAANTTFTESLADGDYVTLMIDDGTAYTITWPTVTWVGGSAPVLEAVGYNIIELWQVNGIVYGVLVGAA